MTVAVCIFTVWFFLLSYGGQIRWIGESLAGIREAIEAQNREYGIGAAPAEAEPSEEETP